MPSTSNASAAPETPKRKPLSTDIQTRQAKPEDKPCKWQATDPAHPGLYLLVKPDR